MEVVAGLNLSNPHPRTWDPASEFYLPGLGAVMVSYADFYRSRSLRMAAIERGIHAALGIPASVRVFLDNGSFFFSRRGLETPAADYETFVAGARPDWKPIPYDAIPMPAMSKARQRTCLEHTMKINRAYGHNGYVPVIHVSKVLGEYVAAVQADEKLAGKPAIALGGIVPHLLRSRSSHSYRSILDSLRLVRTAFAEKHLHLFGVGGTATVHLAALLGIDSADSSGWRNRAARGIVQLPGSGDRIIADLGKWRGRKPSASEWDVLAQCRCPACRNKGIEGLKSSGLSGFCYRATHNLFILLEEADWIKTHLRAGSYKEKLGQRLNNSTYLPIIEALCADPATGTVFRRAV